MDCSALIDSCTTGMSAAGNGVREHGPRAVIESPAVVRRARPSSGSTTSATLRRRGRVPRAPGYCNANSSSGNP